jgi:hypothetical protein
MNILVLPTISLASERSIHIEPEDDSLLSCCTACFRHHEAGLSATHSVREREAVQDSSIFSCISISPTLVLAGVRVKVSSI